MIELVNYNGKKILVDNSIFNNIRDKRFISIDLQPVGDIISSEMVVSNEIENLQLRNCLVFNLSTTDYITYVASYIGERSVENIGGPITIDQASKVIYNTIMAGIEYTYNSVYDNYNKVDYAIIYENPPTNDYYPKQVFTWLYSYLSDDNEYIEFNILEDFLPKFFENRISFDVLGTYNAVYFYNNFYFEPDPNISSRIRVYNRVYDTNKLDSITLSKYRYMVGNFFGDYVKKVNTSYSDQHVRNITISDRGIMCIDYASKVIYANASSQLKMSRHFQGYKIVDPLVLQTSTPSDNSVVSPEGEEVIPDEEYVPNEGSTNNPPLPEIEDVGQDNGLLDEIEPDYEDVEQGTDESTTDEDLQTYDYILKFTYLQTNKYVANFEPRSAYVERYITDEPRYIRDILMANRYVLIHNGLGGNVGEYRSFRTLNYPLLSDASEVATNITFNESDDRENATLTPTFIEWLRNYTIFPSVDKVSLLDSGAFVLIDTHEKIVYVTKNVNVQFNDDIFSTYKVIQMLGEFEENDENVNPDPDNPPTTNPPDTPDTETPPSVNKGTKGTFYVKRYDNNVIVNPSTFTELEEYENLQLVDNSILNPVVIVDKVINANIVHLKAFNRYYHINSIEIEKGLKYRYNLSVDVISSYYDELKYIKGVTNRSSLGSHLQTDDTLIIANECDVIVLEFEDGNFTIPSDIDTSVGRNYVIQVASPYEEE